MFNSLKYAKQLEEVGVSREQAEVHMQIMTEIVETNLATKEDMKDVRQEIKDLGVQLAGKFDQLEAKIIQSEYRATIKTGGMLVVAIGLILGFFKLFI